MFVDQPRARPADEHGGNCQYGNRPERFTQMSDITLSAGIWQNLLSLQQTADLMATTQSSCDWQEDQQRARQSGELFHLAVFSNRASDLASLLDSIGNATQTLQAANNGLYLADEAGAERPGSRPAGPAERLDQPASTSAPLPV